MTVEHISEGFGAHQIHKGYFDAKRKTESAKEGENHSSTSASDRVEISNDARRLMERDSLVGRVRNVLGDAPEVRQEKVRQAVERLVMGLYEQREVLERIAESLLGGGREIRLSSDGKEGSQEVLSTEDVDDGIRWDKIREVEERMNQGFYDQVDVLESIVARLIQGNV